MYICIYVCVYIYLDYKLKKKLLSLKKKKKYIKSATATLLQKYVPIQRRTFPNNIVSLSQHNCARD